MFNHGILGDSNRINKAVFVYKCIADAPTEKIYHIWHHLPQKHLQDKDAAVICFDSLSVGNVMGDFSLQTACALWSSLSKL